MKQNQINKFHNLFVIIVVHNKNSLGQDIVPRKLCDKMFLPQNVAVKFILNVPVALEL